MKCRVGLFYGSVGFKEKLMALLSARMVFSSCNMTTISFFYVGVRHKGKTPEERFILFQEKKDVYFILYIWRVSDDFEKDKWIPNGKYLIKWILCC